MKKIVLLIVLIFIPIKVLGYSTSASSAILMDIDNNRIIYSSNIHEVRSVASISKIMTAILAIESGRLNDVVTISNIINASYGSSVYLNIGETLTLEDLVYALMLRSGNDASLAIAEYVSGSVDEFVKEMNKKAKELNMKDTIFNNPNGLDDPKGNYSTAYDMALLTSYCMKNEIYKKITSTKTYKLKTNKNNYIWNNKNKLLKSYKYTTGGKTGYTDIAKRTLITTASKDNINLVAVTLNDGNDFLDHKNLYEEAFGEYKNYKILKKGYIEIPDEEYYSNVNYYINNDFNYILNKNELNTVVLEFKLDKIYNYENNSKIGNVYVYVDGKKVYEDSVYVEIKKIKLNIFEKILGWLND